MCKHAYEKVSERTKTKMIFCKLMGNDGDLSQLCICQRYCGEQGKYIPTNPKRDCKNYSE